ncbi:cytidylyltransferase domain-containing protein [Aliidiomarina sp. Khilg15.8]
MANVAIIPARGGSKRLPGKNIRDLAGKPLIAWTIEAAIQSGCFDRVIVSTDDEKIAEISRQYGAEVPFMRPPELANDTATSDSVIKHVVEWLEENSNTEVKTVALLQPTSPLRTAQHIQESYALLNEKNANAVISVGEVSTRLELCNYLPEDNSLSEFISDVRRTQEMKHLYELNGAIYILTGNMIGDIKRAYEKGAHSYGYVMSEENSTDIDTEIDFKWAEFLKENRA